jgi:hypothetical protein
MTEELRIWNWTAQTLLHAGKMKEVTVELIKRNLNITALQVKWWNGNGWIDKKKYILFCSEETEKRGRNRTAFVEIKNVRPSTRGFETISKRKSRLRFKELF